MNRLKIQPSTIAAFVLLSGYSYCSDLDIDYSSSYSSYENDNDNDNDDTPYEREEEEAEEEEEEEAESEYDGYFDGKDLYEDGDFFFDGFTNDGEDQDDSDDVIFDDQYYENFLHFRKNHPKKPAQIGNVNINEVAEPGFKRYREPHVPFHQIHEQDYPKLFHTKAGQKTKAWKTINILKEGSYKAGKSQKKVKLSIQNDAEAIFIGPKRTEYINRIAAQKPCPHHKTKYYFKNALTLDAVYPLFANHEHPNVLILNCANAFDIGGGFPNGCYAQEEYLCNFTTLFLSIMSPEAAIYYNCNRSTHRRWFGSDYAILNPHVEIFRNADGSLREIPLHVAVLTIAAPNLTNKKNIDWRKMNKLMAFRIRLIIETAIANGYDTIVLGAFGCGAFKHDPKYISRLFWKILKEYGGFFKIVIFAIPKGYNLNAFSKNFRNVGVNIVQDDGDENFNFFRKTKRTTQQTQLNNSNNKKQKNGPFQKAKKTPQQKQPGDNNHEKQKDGSFQKAKKTPQQKQFGNNNHEKQKDGSFQKAKKAPQQKQPGDNGHNKPKSKEQGLRKDYNHASKHRPSQSKNEGFCEAC